ncbi:hypothetical protein THASP1DRAFT_30113 [Thamnocephalis sphaerospora]|uniref:RRM domain-containing protein n=1 Tax=Thamnocephalis sphaerospora TaxID=78915 RepID=A0A4P9XPY2_9FUNG|nr:hypothetical protein THASP1DRAFT_30113 [Thamnocephalis sphaerospora]|eukprot:RKP08084.1 hypothetical protein THASP1DRAFT_30113 [Thamnocephalis sphaerospora]
MADEGFDIYDDAFGDDDQLMTSTLDGDAGVGKETPSTGTLQRTDDAEDDMFDNFGGIDDTVKWTSEDDLRNIAKEAGVGQQVKDVVFQEHRNNGKSKGVAYMEFTAVEAAEVMKTVLDATELDGKRPLVNYTRAAGNPFRGMGKDMDGRHKRHHNHGNMSGGGGGGSNGTGGGGGNMGRAGGNSGLMQRAGGGASMMPGGFSGMVPPGAAAGSPFTSQGMPGANFLAPPQMMMGAQHFAAAAAMAAAAAAASGNNPWVNMQMMQNAHTMARSGFTPGPQFNAGFDQKNMYSGGGSGNNSNSKDDSAPAGSRGSGGGRDGHQHNHEHRSRGGHGVKRRAVDEGDNGGRRDRRR